jgi:hypothetical protein
MARGHIARSHRCVEINVDPRNIWLVCSVVSGTRIHRLSSLARANQAIMPQSDIDYRKLVEGSFWGCCSH